MATDHFANRLIHLIIIHAAFRSTYPVIQAMPEQVYPDERFLHCVEETVRKDLEISSNLRSTILAVLYTMDERRFSR
jgi:hypothetical protein